MRLGIERARDEADAARVAAEAAAAAAAAATEAKAKEPKSGAEGEAERDATLSGARVGARRGRAAPPRGKSSFRIRRAPRPSRRGGASSGAW